MKKVLFMLLVQGLALYGYSFLFMLEGQPARHGSYVLQVLAGVCIGLFFLAPAALFVWAGLTASITRPESVRKVE